MIAVNSYHVSWNNHLPGNPNDEITCSITEVTAIFASGYSGIYNCWVNHADKRAALGVVQKHIKQKYPRW